MIVSWCDKLCMFTAEVGGTVQEDVEHLVNSTDQAGRIYV